MRSAAARCQRVSSSTAQPCLAVPTPCQPNTYQPFYSGVLWPGMACPGTLSVAWGRSCLLLAGPTGTSVANPKPPAAAHQRGVRVRHHQAAHVRLQLLAGLRGAASQGGLHEPTHLPRGRASRSRAQPRRSRGLYRSTGLRLVAQDCDKGGSFHEDPSRGWQDGRARRRRTRRCACRPAGVRKPTASPAAHTARVSARQLSGTPSDTLSGSQGASGSPAGRPRQRSS